VTSPSELCEIIEDVLDPERSRARYAVVDLDGYQQSIQLPIEPRATLLQRGRSAWLNCYSISEPQRAGHA